MPLDVQALREREFPALHSDPGVYLNAASTGPLPARCVDAVTEWTRLRATPHRIPDHMLFATLARSRELAARMIGAEPGEIALAVNTGFGINLAARALPLARGDVILTPDLEFPANVYPWWAAALERGAEYRRVPLVEGVSMEDSLLRALDQGPVRVLSVSWIGFADGYRLDLARIGAACRERGVWFVVDAIQGVGACPIDVKAAQVDILACGAQKWLLSPWGSGFAYVRSELARTLAPPVVSWMAPRGTDDFRRLRDYDMTWRDDARRFELITLPFPDFAGMNASLELFFELGLPAVHAHVERLAMSAVRWAQSHGVQLVTPVDSGRRGGIVCLRPRDAEAASARLAAAGVAHSYREGSIRLSPHMYNTSAELANALGLISS